MEWSPLPDEIVHRPSPNYGYDGVRPKWRAVTWHITDGPLDASLDWLTNPASQASAHVVIARDATIYSLVPLSEPAWTHGKKCNPDMNNPVVRQTADAGVNPNLRAYGIECVGMSTDGRGGSLTLPQSAALQRVTAYLCVRAGITCDRTHVLGHYQWDNCTRSRCPGYSESEWLDWVGRAHALTLLWRGW